MNLIPLLTNRESEVLDLIISEYTTSEIAKELHVSISTIKTHRKNLLMKFQARNVAGLVRRVYECKIQTISARNNYTT